MLKHFDLPHVAGAIADRELTLINPVDAMKKTVSAEETVPLTRGSGRVRCSPENQKNS